MKTITLKKTGYVVKGTADLTLWGGGNACIKMKQFKVKSINEKALLSKINDNGFGVQSINGAICDIYENYEGTLKYYTNKYVGNVSDNTEDYHNQFQSL